MAVSEIEKETVYFQKQNIPFQYKYIIEEFKEIVNWLSIDFVHTFCSDICIYIIYIKHLLPQNKKN